jgi:hypothetical protein
MEYDCNYKVFYHAGTKSTVIDAQVATCNLQLASDKQSSRRIAQSLRIRAEDFIKELHKIYL